MKTPINSENIKITSYYGNRQYYYQGKLIKDFHNGIDLVPSPCNNNEILAFADGIVTSVQKTGVQYGTGCYVRLKHNNGLYTLYYHLKSGSVCVNVGDNVRKGQKLGIIGTTGQSTGIHLHFQIDKGSSNTSINPYDYLFGGKEFMPDTPQEDLSKYSDEELARKVINGDYGNGEARKNTLGDRYNVVQSLVNKILNGEKQEEKPDILELVKKTIRGDFGNGDARKQALGNNYSEVQRQVNLNYQNGTTNWNNIKLY
jgi:hypothetical protein